MRIFTVTILLMCLSFLNLNAQNAIKGIVINSDSKKPLQGVLISVKETNFNSLTNFNGGFTLNNLPKKELVITVSLKGFTTQNIPIQVTEGLLDLGNISIDENTSNDIDLSIITLTDDELNDDSSIADNITGLLQSSKDTYLLAAAYEWSASFYSIKGLGSENKSLFCIFPKKKMVNFYERVFFKAFLRSSSEENIYILSTAGAPGL